MPDALPRLGVAASFWSGFGDLFKNSEEHESRVEHTRKKRRVSVAFGAYVNLSLLSSEHQYIMATLASA